jgi:hypothetical protein
MDVHTWKCDSWRREKNERQEFRGEQHVAGIYSMTVEVEEDEVRDHEQTKPLAAGRYPWRSSWSPRSGRHVSWSGPEAKRQSFAEKYEWLLPSSCRLDTNLNGSRAFLTQQGQDMAFDPASQCNRSLSLSIHFSVILGWGAKTDSYTFLSGSDPAHGQPSPSEPGGFERRRRRGRRRR